MPSTPQGENVKPSTEGDALSFAEVTGFLPNFLMTVPEIYSVPSHIGYKKSISTNPKIEGLAENFVQKYIAKCILKKQFLISYRV